MRNNNLTNPLNRDLERRLRLRMAAEQQLSPEQEIDALVDELELEATPPVPSPLADATSVDQLDTPIARLYHQFDGFVNEMKRRDLHKDLLREPSKPGNLEKLKAWYLVTKTMVDKMSETLQELETTLDS